MDPDELADILDDVHEGEPPNEADLEAALSDWLSEQSHIDQLASVNCPRCGDPIDKDDFAEHVPACSG
jgi:hypothetical protein